MRVKLHEVHYEDTIGKSKFTTAELAAFTINPEVSDFSDAENPNFRTLGENGAFIAITRDSNLKARLKAICPSLKSVHIHGVTDYGTVDICYYNNIGENRTNDITPILRKLPELNRIVIDTFAEYGVALKPIRKEMAAVDPASGRTPDFIIQYCRLESIDRSTVMNKRDKHLNNYVFGSSSKSFFSSRELKAMRNRIAKKYSVAPEQISFEDDEDGNLIYKINR